MAEPAEIVFLRSERGFILTQDVGRGLRFGSGFRGKSLGKSVGCCSCRKEELGDDRKVPATVGGPLTVCMFIHGEMVTSVRLPGRRSMRRRRGRGGRIRVVKCPWGAEVSLGFFAHKLIARAIFYVAGGNERKKKKQKRCGRSNLANRNADSKKKDTGLKSEKPPSDHKF